MMPSAMRFGIRGARRCPALHPRPETWKCGWWGNPHEGSNPSRSGFPLQYKALRLIHEREFRANWRLRPNRGPTGWAIGTALRLVRTASLFGNRFDGQVPGSGVNSVEFSQRR
jgi:hypothetical protein